LFGIPEIVAQIYADDPFHWAVVATSAVQALLIAVLIPAAIYRARRYRLTRTNWRGVRGGQSGSTLGYVGQSILAYIGIVISLGWLWPVMNLRLMRYEMKNTWFGSLNVFFEAKAKPLYRYFLIMAGLLLLLGLLVGLAFASTISGIEEQAAQEGTQSILPMIIFMATYGVTGIISVALFQWYLGNELRYYLNHTKLGPMQVRCTMTGGQYAGVFLANLFTVIFTLGLGMPWVYMRYLRFMEKTLSLEGTMDYAELVQGEHERPTVGEGLADAFEVGAI